MCILMAGWVISLRNSAAFTGSPEFEGRGPGTPGEEKTVAWLVQRFKALGLEPGGEDGSFVAGGLDVARLPVVAIAGQFIASRRLMI